MPWFRIQGQVSRAKVLSATGKADGTNVVSGDLVRLKNLLAGDGGYLDTNGPATAEQQSVGGKFNVSTSKDKDRDPSGTGRWRLFAPASTPGGQHIRPGDVVHVFNGHTVVAEGSRQDAAELGDRGDEASGGGADDFLGGDGGASAAAAAGGDQALAGALTMSIADLARR